jgi:hypothetical protein
MYYVPAVYRAIIIYCRGFHVLFVYGKPDNNLESSCMLYVTTETLTEESVFESKSLWSYFCCLFYDALSIPDCTTLNHRTIGQNYI